MNWDLDPYMMLYGDFNVWNRLASGNDFYVALSSSGTCTQIDRYTCHFLDFFNVVNDKIV